MIALPREGPGPARRLVDDCEHLTVGFRPISELFIEALL
jgi:hypothetical protein